MTIRVRLAAFVFLGAVGCAAVAQAQQPAGAPAPMAGQGWRDDMRQHMQERRAEHIKALHAALNIRPDQEAAFSAFAAAMQALAPADQREHEMGEHGMGQDRAAMASMTTPQRLDLMSQKMDERMARMRDHFQRRATATKALYAALGPDQRRTLDALPDLMGRGHGGAHGPWGAKHGGVAE